MSCDGAVFSKMAACPDDDRCTVVRNTMSDDSIIRIDHLRKEYRLYSRPFDRVREAISPTRKKYSKVFTALDGITIDVKKGETVGVIGENGAGKSTLLKLITGVLHETSGEMTINGKIAALLELGAGFNPEYSGIENIYLNGRLMGYTRAEMNERLDAIVEFADIGEYIYQPVKMYSSGMFARLAFAVSINVEPEILIVDEALSVGDVLFQNKCFRKFEELRDRGVTVLFVSHDIASVRQMCSRVLWLEAGKQKAFDRCDRVCDAYMDEKRSKMNSFVDGSKGEEIPEIEKIEKEDNPSFPELSYKSSQLISRRCSIRSFFIRDEEGRNVQEMVVDRNYEVHVVIDFSDTITNLILGFIIENNKGLPLFDLNNFISQGKTWVGEEGTQAEVIFQFKLPRLMKGKYIASIGLSRGTQENPETLTWLHGVMDLEIVNPGYNSSYIEIPSKVTINQYTLKDG